MNTYRIENGQRVYSSLREAHAHRQEQAVQSGESVRIYSGTIRRRAKKVPMERQLHKAR